jgi:hypothetical protein
MTIRVVITNDDSRPEAVVIVNQLNLDGSEIPGIPEKRLAGGEQCEKYVHNSNQIVIKEA